MIASRRSQVLVDDRPRPVTPALDLQAFLAREHLEVLDIARGAAPGTRRLIVGSAATLRASHVVALASEAAGSAAVASEIRCLRELDHRLRPQIRVTVPSVVEEITIDGTLGAVLTAVPGVAAQRSVPAPGATLQQADAVLGWLTSLWEDTAGPDEEVDLGREAYDALTAAFAGSRAASVTLEVLGRSRSLMSGTGTPRTASHGCLCPRHVRVDDGQVTGVDDWGLSSLAGDPLRDLGAWVVSTADARIDAVLSGRTRSGRLLRNLVADGLRHWGISTALWRDVLVLSLAEAAAAALADGDATVLDLLGRTAEALPRDRRRDGWVP